MRTWPDLIPSFPHSRQDKAPGLTFGCHIVHSRGMKDDATGEILDPEELDWVQVRAYIAPDLAQLARTARADGALVRCREVKSSDDLIRTILAYACGGSTLADRGTCAG